MKKFAKISAVLVSLLLVFSVLGCKNDSDDDKQSYLLEGGVISKTDYEKLGMNKYTTSYYTSAEVYSYRSTCMLYTKDGTYVKESVDEEDLDNELEFLTASQIQLIRESESMILFFETTNSDEYIWLYSQKE